MFNLLCNMDLKSRCRIWIIPISTPTPGAVATKKGCAKKKDASNTA